MKVIYINENKEFDEKVKRFAEKIHKEWEKDNDFIEACNKDVLSALEDYEEDFKSNLSNKCEFVCQFGSLEDDEDNNAYESIVNSIQNNMIEEIPNFLSDKDEAPKYIFTKFESETGLDLNDNEKEKLLDVVGKTCGYKDFYEFVYDCSTVNDSKFIDACADMAYEQYNN